VPAIKFGGILVGIWAVGLIGAGAFLTDPVSGYRPGTPPTPAGATTSGTLFSVAAFFALGAACFALAGGKGWRWAIYSVLNVAAFLGAFFVAAIGFNQTEPFVEVAGLWQRVCVLIGWAWLTMRRGEAAAVEVLLGDVLGWAAGRSNRGPSRRRPSGRTTGPLGRRRAGAAARTACADQER
jgi:hypothetical protein